LAVAARRGHAAGANQPNAAAGAMIYYDNGQECRMIVQLIGSVLPKTLPMALTSFALGTTLAILRFADLTPEIFGMEDYLDSSFASFILGTAIGYLLVMRVNMALDRWMSAMTEIEVMLSRWADAYNALTSFFAGRRGENMDRIHLFRIRTAHWFTLMACLVFGTLRGRGLRSLKSLEIRPLYPIEAEPTTFQRRSSVNSDNAQVCRMLSKASTARFAARTGRGHLVVLHAPSSEEVALLEPSSDKVNTICLWIIQAIMTEVRAKVLDAPPPIITRVFQEISEGMHGFQQAYKVAMVPFPFPFSQVMALILAVLYITFPFYIDMFTKNIILTPIMCFIVPVCYCALNQLSIELEDPFAYSVNDIEIEHMNREFVSMIEDTLWGPLEPPMQRGRPLEFNVAQGILDERGDFTADFLPTTTSYRASVGSDGFGTASQQSMK